MKEKIELGKQIQANPFFFFQRVVNTIFSKDILASCSFLNFYLEQIKLPVSFFFF